MPKKRKTKYIFVSGGVLSSLGKGITTASIGVLLQSRGYQVTIVKCENYLNIDAGLINPIEHGDTFLCQDGTEADMDIGNYERFLNKDFGVHNFITMGQVYKTVIDRERNFGYDGEDVEAIPHVTDEIIKRIKEGANHDQAEICLVELGGTVGEYQNALYYEAARLMKSSRGDTVLHIHVSYLPIPKHIGEPKTKPTQLSVKELNSMGIKPDFLVARSEKPLDNKRIKKLAMFCSIDPQNVISNEDTDSIFTIPLGFHKQNFDSKILQELALKSRKSNLREWRSLVSKIKAKKNKQAKIAIVGKYFKSGDYKLEDAYASLIETLQHTAVHQGIELLLTYVDAEKLTKSNLKTINSASGIIVPIGWGSRGVEGKIKAIEYARTNRVPFLGLCFGMQLAVVEFARNVAGIKSAGSTEIDPKTKNPVIHIIPEQKRNIKKRAYGGTMRLGAWDCKVIKGTRVWDIYAAHNAFKNISKGIVSERHRHRYEFNAAYTKKLEKAGLIFSGISTDEGLVEFIELPESTHPFFIATQAHPEYKSRPLAPHPLFIEFLNHAVKPAESNP